ncbi:MAG: transposase [Hymenobacter sp.]|nr:MAG: transposase [Hymenobacter sp.]
MVWMARTGAQWRHLPDEYGKWNSVFRRYRRWVVTGVFEAMLETLAAVVERDVCGSASNRDPTRFSPTYRKWVEALQSQGLRTAASRGRL